MNIIEVHGMGMMSRHGYAAFHLQVSELIGSASYRKDLDLERFPTEILSLDHHQRPPFLRVAASGEFLAKHFGDVCRRLQPLGLAIQAEYLLDEIPPKHSKDWIGILRESASTH